MKKTVWVLAFASLAPCAALHAGQLRIMQQDGAQATGMVRDASMVVATATAGPFASSWAMLWNTATGEESVLPDMDAAYAISGSGSILGTLGIGGGVNQGGSDHAAILVPGAASAVALLPEPQGQDSTLGYAISDDGVVAGSYYTSIAALRAVVWDAGATMTDLPVRDPALQSAAYAISRAGDAPGGPTIGGFVASGDAFGTQNAVIWRGAQHLPRYPVNEDGHAVGPALGVSSDGRYVVGATYDTTRTGHAFDAWLWDADTDTVRRIPGMDIAQAVSLDGRTVTGSRGFPTRVSMVWREGRGTATLRDVLEELDVGRPAGWVKPEGALNLVSDDGRTIGGCCVPMPDGFYGHSFLVSGGPVGDDRLFADAFEEGPIHDDVIIDGGFESTGDSGGPNPAWTGTDGNPDAPAGSTVFFDESRLVGSAARHGLWMAMFGGYQGGAAEVQTIAQSVVVPKAGALRLRYGYYLAYNADAPARLLVSIDGRVVDTIDAMTDAPTSDYVLRSIDVSAIGDAGTHALVFRYEYAGGVDSDGKLLIDDVQLGALTTTAQTTR